MPSSIGAPDAQEHRRRFAPFECWFLAGDSRRAPRNPPVSSPASYRPNVEVIVPGFNEERVLLAACLRSLCQQDYGGEVRVWVVDDGSDNREGDDQPGREQHLRVARGGSASSTWAPATPGRVPC